jgi:hypothetical protein
MNKYKFNSEWNYLDKSEVYVFGNKQEFDACAFWQ